MSVLARCHLRKSTVHLRDVMSVAQTILDALGESQAELSLEIVGNHRIQRLNRTYRHHDHPTDVLSFPIREVPGPHTMLLGDVVISLPMALKQAKHADHSPDEELVTLLIHGILHLLGYDHEHNERDARRMRRKETALLRQLRPLPRLIRMNGLKNTDRPLRAIC